jgi:hypothetical protein
LIVRQLIWADDDVAPGIKSVESVDVFAAATAIPTGVKRIIITATTAAAAAVGVV